MVILKHPLFDDEQKFFDYGSDGKLLQSSMIVVLDASIQETESGPMPNIQIMSKGGNGVKRTYVEGYINGLTGWMQKPMTSSRDSLTWECLKEDMIVIHNVQSCGIIRKTPLITSI